LGLVADPFHPTRFASFSEDGFIRIWDSLISLTEPLLVINSDFRQNLKDMSFSPAHDGLLCAFAKENSIIRIWQLDPIIQSQSNSKEDINRDLGVEKENSDKVDVHSGSSPLKMKSISISWTRTGNFCITINYLVKPKINSQINGVKWLNKPHPSLLVCAGKDYQVFVFDIPVSPVSSWSPTGQLSILSETVVQQFHPGQARSSETDGHKKSQIYDIAKIMYDRANQNYGLNVYFTLISNDELV
jgi:WD40 repeat protein